MIKVYVSRFNKTQDKNPHIECYEIPKKPQMKILDALKSINKKYDADISYRSSCRAGQCGSCSLKVNGEGALGCQREIEDGDLIEPLDFPIIKDLVVDRNEADKKVKKLNLNLEGYHCDHINESITAEKVEDMNKVRKCIECYSCLSSCPVVKYFPKKYGGPYFMRYLSKFDHDPRDKDDRLSESLKEGLYKCTSCGNCLAVCPKNINTFGDAIVKFRQKACQDKKGPLPAHLNFKENIQKTGRSVDGEYSFVKEYNQKNKNKNKSKIALFTGCMVDKRTPHVGQALVNILKAHNIDIEIPQNQVCCASPLINTGQSESVQKLVDKNKEVFKDYDTIITICAGCGNTLKNKHKEYGSDLNVLDISEFLVDKLNYDEMKNLDMKVTWHDPCHLARGQKIKTSPREILENMKGVDLIEMQYPDQCCGAGGGVKSGHPEIALKLAGKKAQMIEDTGAKAVITICPFCQKNLKDGLENEDLKDVEVMNILELIEKAL